MRDDGTLLYRTKPDQVNVKEDIYHIVLCLFHFSSLPHSYLDPTLEVPLRYLNHTTTDDRLRDIDDLHLPSSTLSLPIQRSDA